MRPLLSIIIPVYESAAYLLRCVDSLLANLPDGAEAIFVDDGSTDGSSDALDEYARRNQCIRLVSQKHSGPAAARNRGLDTATGEYVYFLDADDELAGDGVFAAFIAHAENTGADIVLADALEDRHDGKGPQPAYTYLRRELIPSQPAFAPESMANNLFMLSWGGLGGKLFRRKFLVDSGVRLPESCMRSEDFPFAELTLAMAKSVSVFASPVFVRHFDNPNSLEATKDMAPTVFIDAERILLEEIDRRQCPAWVVDAARVRSVVRIDYNLRHVRTREALEAVVGASRKLYSEIRPPEGVQAFRDYHNSKQFVERVLCADDPWLAVHGETVVRRAAKLPQEGPRRSEKSNGRRGRWQVIWSHRFLFEELVKRDFKKKYKRTVVGMGWSMLMPLCTLGVMYVFFSQIFGRRMENFATYLFCGNVIFGFFSESTSAGMVSIFASAGIFTKVAVPKYLFLFARNVQTLVNLALTLVVFFGFLALDGIPFSWRFVCLLYPILTLIVFNVGVGLVLSALYIFFRDMDYLWRVFLQLMMYGSAIFYPIDSLPASMQSWFAWNPIYRHIDYFRQVTLHGVFPDVESHLTLAAWALGAFAIGALVYKKYNRRFLYYV